MCGSLHLAFSEDYIKFKRKALEIKATWKGSERP